ncbi:RutC family protein [Ceratobasidium theobromae]|uniref:RutC family protein n=1 Tax=Ceratobasidium theobromae TaxID=1582974 RepID=A0A5N5QTL7_9AGAM|nr:RutC family protein [Ceratobasidium theobromae]
MSFVLPSLTINARRIVHPTLLLRSSMSTGNLHVVSTPEAPAAIGPYSQAIKAGGFIFVSGCIPLVPSSMEVVKGGIKEQTAQALANLRAIVTASGSEIDRVAKTTVFLQSMNDFADMNEVYAGFFGSHKPARSAVEVARLPRDVLVEVECIVLAP